MSVLINFKICDNDKACSGMSICPNHVFSWDEENKTLQIDNEKCISCGLCKKACMVSAIRVAKNEEEYKKIEKEIQEDTRNINDLLIDRYGAKPIDIAMVGKEEEIEEKVNSKRPMMVEIYNEDSIMCLLKSIPIKEIADYYDKETRYRKVEITTDRILKKYQIKELPALLFFRDSNYIGKIEGYYTEEQKEELQRKIDKWMRK